jgi:nicotinamidase-related amidase
MASGSAEAALLVMDMQSSILQSLADTVSLIDHTARAIENARSHNIPVLYVTVGFRPGAPELSRNNKAFTASKERWANADPAQMMKIESPLTPATGEIVVIKRRVSAFAGSDLEIVLRSMGIRHIVLCGVATSGVVLSTVREAADKDYRITVLADCCADADPEVHRVLTTKVFLRQADVITQEEWSKSI